ncbi:cilia- and flagella-associated protein 44-like [Watersipora subatra]|uniref:cilia- and flagella-associated protein 44-like n=1 Tax=Watersipora subatra TaxID=2589382 RepID=UPI00355C1340
MSDEVKKDDKPSIPDDHYYDYQLCVSKPKITEDSGLPPNMLQLSHSFGYDCRRRGNLVVLDERTVAYVAGNLVQLVDIISKEQKYIRSTGGVAIGAIALHPSRKWLAVAEKGTVPDINIYEYSSLRLHRILRGGTQLSYAYVCFSPDGKLLASVGGEPDFMLTLWNWKEEQTVLRSKAFSQDVFRVSFSTELEGQLTSAGTGHIRFWKMAHTFTGLKLQGELGKFGKTEISDIEGYVELPDGKVLSGCENGNMLLWDGGLIKVEISRKGKKPCHQGPIQQIIMDEGELMSVGEDGCVRVWDFETIDNADSTDETGLFEMEPMNEIKIGGQEHVSLMSIVKSVDEAEEPTIWYAQDANGGIWKLDLSFSHTSATPERLMYYHAGAIAGCSASPVTHLVATTGADKTVRVHDYVNNVTICESLLNAEGTSIIWAPKLVDIKGATIIAGFGDGVVRSFVLSKKDESSNRKGASESELLLTQVFKPHVKAVTCMAFDSAGETLATASEDGSVFFFNVSNKEYKPIGFVSVAGSVTHISWSPGAYKKNSLLVCCANGFAQEIECPEPGTFDTSRSYQIEGLAIRTHQFKSVKSELRHEEELERKRLEEEAAKKKKDEERRLRIERGLASASDDEDEEEVDAKEEEEEWKPYIPSTPSAILQGYYSMDEPGTFWLSMDDFDAGYLYQCKFTDEGELQRVPEDERYKPIRTVAVDDLGETPISVIHFSDTHKQVLCGTQTGVIRAHPLSSADFSNTNSYWELSMHDNHVGAISAIEVSYDGAYVITVGQDGNFFAYNYMSQKEVDEEVVKAKIPSAFKLPEDKQLPDDIEDPQAYSIEDAKQKAEHDKMMREAEERKQEVRRIITQLRRQFKKLLEKNHELPVHLRLDSIEFEMDPEIKKELARQTQEKIDTVKKELAWDSEKQQIALDKLKMRFKAMVECERIVVKSFKSTYEVSTYRAAKLSDDFYSLKAELEQRKETSMSKARSDLSRDPSLLNAARKDSASGDVGGDSLAAKTQTNLKGSMGQRIQKALQKVEQKKKKRAARKAQWNELYANRPDDNYEDPDDVAAIAEAQSNMGDYKLKTADDYVVPDHLRMNVEKAIMKLLVLKELIHEVKYAFNKKVLALRDQKMGIIDQISNYVAELIQIKAQLGNERAKAIPPVPTMHPDELPERRMEYTRESLLDFKAEMEKQAILAKTGGTQGGFGGFGGGGGGAGAEKKAGVKKESVKQADKDSSSAAGEESFDHFLERRAIEPTPLELQIRKAQEIRLLYQQDFLLRKISEMLGRFDSELRYLYFEKLKLDVDLKNADLRYIILFEEFLLLKEYEKHENTLGNRLAAKQQEKIDQQTKVAEVAQKIEIKKKDIEKLQEKEKALHAMFIQSLGDNNKFSDYLTKVFKKKIKRSKKKENAGGDSDDESEEESSDDEDWSESDDESGSEGGGFDLDICPPGCDQSLYNNTTQLRERRLDIEEVLTEEKKNRDQLVKDSENITKRTRVILAGLKSAEADLEAFQLEKQQKLNEFDIVVTLRLHQILHNENGRLPNDLLQCLVFNSPDLVRLSHRIKELEHEKAVQKRQQKDNKKKHIQLIKDRKLFDGKIGELEAKCDEEMVLKFGRIVDLEELEQVTVNRQVEELKEKLRVTEIECSDDLKRYEEKIRRRKDKITDLIRENTNRIETLNMMQTEKRDLQLQLDSKQKSLGGEFSGVRKADVHEKQRLIQLVQLQAQEVDALKEEIVMLSHKGGHILPPAQPPIPGEPLPISRLQ